MTIKIALLSAGLGNISRGFEISSATWFEGIRNKDQIHARLFSGGKKEGATTVWNIPRNGKIASYLRKLKIIKDGVRLEQISFSVGFLLHLIFYRPNIIWLQEATLAEMLLTYKNKFGFKYKIIFCDGAPVGHEIAKKFDYIIFLHQYALKEATISGINSNKCKVIPHLSLLPDFSLDKQNARAKLNIASDKFVIICVAAWNRNHKRIDYLFNEVALLDSTGITLLLCGQPEQDSDSLVEMANLLNLDVLWRTFSQKDLSLAYAAADLFVLPSLNEGLGAVIIEAGAHSLPVICHPHAGGRFILGENYPGLTDLSIKGNLAKKIMSYSISGNLQQEGNKTEKIIREKFNKEKLTSSFVDFIKFVSQNS